MAFSARYIFASALCALSLGAPAQAATPSTVTASSHDPLVEGAMMCTRYFPRYEREYAIPTHLLSAIASTESGRYNEKLKIKLPWPWTVTSGGVGRYYDTKSEAVAAVKKLKASGVKNIDVGCMQVNLYHHSDAFANIEQAFEPEYNINYAATFLRKLYDEEHSWKQAASDYHSKTPSLGTKYIGMVYDSWFNIIEKLRAARLAVPASSVNGMAELKGAKPSSKATLASAKVEPYPAAASKPVYQAPRMNSIKVNTVAETDTTPDSVSYTRPARDTGVLVIRPAESNTNGSAAVQKVSSAQPAPITLADNIYAAASVNNAPAPVQAAANVQSLALTQNGSQMNASVSVPLNGLTQAAVAPVTGLANTVLASATDAAAQQLQPATATPTPRGGDLDVTSEYTVRGTQDSSAVSYRSGPNFIFNE